MQEQIDDIQKQVTKITTALIGDELTQEKGLIHQVEKNTKYRKGAIKRLTLVSGFFTGLGIAIKQYFS